MSTEQQILTSMTDDLISLMIYAKRRDLVERKLMIAAASTLQSIYRILEALSLAPSDDVIDCCADLETYFNTNPLSIPMGALI